MQSSKHKTVEEKQQPAQWIHRYWNSPCNHKRRRSTNKGVFCMIMGSYIDATEDYKPKHRDEISEKE